jgi:hypothetical protein
VNDLGLCTIDYSEDEIPPSLPLLAHSSSILYCLGKLPSSQAPWSPPGALVSPAGPPQARRSAGDTLLQQRLYNMRPEVSGTADALAGASETKQRRQAQHKRPYQKSKKRKPCFSYFELFTAHDNTFCPGMVKCMEEPLGWEVSR